jgi:hypothetical protein
MVASYIRILWVVTSILIATSVSCSGRGDTLVTLTLSQLVGEAPEGEHYELFASISGSAVQIKRFVVLLQLRGNGSFEKSVFDFDEAGDKLGVVDGLGADGQIIGGVRFRSPTNLRGATDLFITLKRNEDDDKSPGTNVVMSCTLAEETPDVLSCVMVSSLDGDVVMGTAALVLPSRGDVW